jgi:hypothetical protein
VSSASNPQRRRRAAAQLCLLIALMLAVPLAFHPLDARFGMKNVPASYLPALEGPRVRRAFEPGPIAELAAMKPGSVAIGDSMAGTRIHTTRLGELTGMPSVPILQAGSGSAYWYLALKNWVIASGARPKVVLIFFRDTNLTDVMFRLDESFRWNIDRVAGEREDELNAVIAARAGAFRYRLRSTVGRLYASEQVKLWLEPWFTERIGRALIPSRREHRDFVARMNARFDFAHMRPFEAADYVTIGGSDADFYRDVDRSVLPLMLRDARQAGIRLCFVRVQRRPVGDRPPEQSSALRQYVADLRDYVESRGAIFIDDTGDPALPLAMYDDGDHVNAGWTARYTEHLYERLRPRLQ